MEQNLEQTRESYLSENKPVSRPRKTLANRLGRIRRRNGTTTRKPFSAFVPNVLTLCGMVAGITGIHLALNSHCALAIIAILVAAFFDGIDGRVARRLGVTSRFGGELDSLSDFATFGVSPAVIVYIFALQQLGNLGWGIVAMFAISMSLRLARFNTASIDGSPRPMFNFATGVPAPAAAYMVLWPLIIKMWLGVAIQPEIYAGWVFVVSLFTVSRIPTFLLKSGKKTAQRNAIFSFLCFSATLALGYSYPWAVLAAFGVVYIGSIFVSVRLYKIELQKWKDSKAAEAVEEKEKNNG
jgi:CDP-diacylglycerol--serine O-phosphatidyltransferase